MKKKSVRRTKRHVAQHRTPKGENYLVVVRGWMLVVAFALMLGLGAMVGDFVQQQINATTPEVAGVQVEAQ